MSNSFASLLRGSRLATFDRSIQQVYQTTSHSKKIGDWGLKRNLPTVVRTPYLTVDSLDTAEHQTPWQSGCSQVLFVKRWKENFAQSNKPAPRTDIESHNIVKMTPAEFNQFLQLCAKKAPEFGKLLQQKEIVSEQVFEYLQVRFSDGPGDCVVGPTYSENTVTTPNSVQGRILNADRRIGHIVGVGGIAAFLPKRYSSLLRQLGDRSVRTFYVEEASIDEEGRPKVVLSINANSSKQLYKFIYEENPGSTQTVHEMFLTKGPTRKSEPDNIQANPDHQSLMRRMERLIGNSSETK